MHKEGKIYMFILHVCEVYIYIYMYIYIYLYTHTYTYMPLAKTWMELEGIMQSKIIETGKDKYHVISFLCELKKEKNKQTKKLQPNLYIQRKDW